MYNKIIIAIYYYASCWLPFCKMLKLGKLQQINKKSSLKVIDSFIDKKGI